MEIVNIETHIKKWQKIKANATVEFLLQIKKMTLETF